MYDVFISCKSEDYTKAEAVFHWLVEKGYNPFFAPISLRVSTIQGEPVVFGDEIDDALEQADNMIVFTSNAEYVKKGYVKDEWRTFVEEQRAGRKTGSLVTILDDVNVADLPIRLRSVQSFTLSNYITGILRFLGDSLSNESGSNNSIKENNEDGERAVKTEMGIISYVIDKEKCIGCGKCKCPVDAILKTDYIAFGHRLPSMAIDSQKCVNCGVCISDCGFDAINKLGKEKERLEAERRAKEEAERKAKETTEKERIERVLDVRNEVIKTAANVLIGLSPMAFFGLSKGRHTKTGLSSRPIITAPLTLELLARGAAAPDCTKIDELKWNEIIQECKKKNDIFEYDQINDVLDIEKFTKSLINHQIIIDIDKMLEVCSTIGEMKTYLKVE